MINTPNLGRSWACSAIASAPVGRSWRLQVPGGNDPAAAARASDRSVVSVGLMETGADGVERLVRSAHVPMRDYDNQRLLRRLQSLAYRLPQLRHRDLERGLDIAPTPLAWPEAPTRTLCTVLADAACSTLSGWPLVPSAARIGRRALTYASYQLGTLAGYDRWRVGVVAAPIERFLDPMFRPDVDWYAPDARQQYAADPFALPARAFDPSAPPDAVRVLFEHFDYNAPRGRIDSVDWSPTTGFGSTRHELALDSHLSYPYLFEHDGELWMAPENCEAGRLVAYRRHEGRWVDPHPLLEGFEALDGTLVRHRGRWWLFATNAREEPVHELHAWVADSPLGPWTPHAGNPLLIDPRAGRPGGSMFHHAGRLYRVAQDCSRTYGGAAVIAEVHQLDERSFGQRIVRRLTAESVGGGYGLHTLTACGSITVLDVKDRTPSVSETRRRVLRRFGRA